MTDYEWLVQSDEGDRAIAPSVGIQIVRDRVGILLSSSAEVGYIKATNSASIIGGGTIDFVNVYNLDVLHGRQWTHILEWYGPPHPYYSFDEINERILSRIY